MNTSHEQQPKGLKVIFMGTPEFAVEPMEAILDSDHQIIAVYSQPPRPKGRGHHIQKSPVHMIANVHDIPVYTPKSLRKNDDLLKKFQDHNADIAIVVAYGQILPFTFLESLKYGCLNIHASLLPRWRGAAPIQHAIWAGDTETGVCIMQMDKGLDTGDVIARKTTLIGDTMTAQHLHDTLCTIGADMIIDVLDNIAQNGAPDATTQNSDQATYASMLTKDDGRVDWSQSAAQIDHQIRALTPWPGVWTMTEARKRLKIISAIKIENAEYDTSLPAGTILNENGDIICGEAIIRLINVQPENAKAMDFTSALNGGYLSVGTQLL